MTGKNTFPPALLPAAAGAVILGLDAAGMVGENLFLGTLELFCGCLAGAGLAALWMQKHYTAWDKILAGVLLVCHILNFWLWIPFAIGLFCRNAGQNEPDRPWRNRVLYLMLLILGGAGGYSLFYWGFSAPQPDIPVYQTAAGLITALLIPLLTTKYLLKTSWPAAASAACRFTALYAGELLFCSLARLRYRPPEAWYIYAVIALIFAVTIWGGWRKKLPAGTAKVHWAAWGVILILASWHMILDCWLDHRYFGYHSTQEYFVSRFHQNSPPILNACRQYREKYKAWPDYPEQLQEFMKGADTGEVYITGFHTDANGDFLLFLKRERRIWVMVYRLRPDGTESWEYAAPNHPQRKPGDRRWKHSFPYTD